MKAGEQTTRNTPLVRPLQGAFLSLLSRQIWLISVSTHHMPFFRPMCHYNLHPMMTETAIAR